MKLLDVGCASGEIYRYFREIYPLVQYTGCDISQTGIMRARQKYPAGNFVLTDLDLSQVKDSRPDYVFCRDVVIHQNDPMSFLKILCSIPSKGLILRLRTRDKGASVIDAERSCQINYGQWAPYMVLNCDEMIALFRGIKGCSKVRIMRHYMVLGGWHSRFLPKECYLEETKTAETAVYVEFDRDSDKPVEVISEVRKERMQPSLLCQLLRYGVKAIFGRSQGKVIW